MRTVMSRALCSVVVLGLLLHVAAAMAQGGQFTAIGTIDTSRINQDVFVSGAVREHRTPTSERAPHILFTTDGTGEIQVVFWKDTFAEMTYAADLVAGAKVEVFGRVTEYNGRLQLNVRRADAIRVLGKGDVPAAGAARPAVAPADSGIPGKPVALGQLTEANVGEVVSFRGKVIQLTPGKENIPTRAIIEDATGSITVVYWDELATALTGANAVERDGVYLVSGKVDVHRGALQVKPRTVSDIARLGADGSLPAAPVVAPPASAPAAVTGQTFGAPSAAAPPAPPVASPFGGGAPAAQAAPGASPFRGIPAAPGSAPGAAPAPSPFGGAPAAPATMSAAPGEIVIDDKDPGFTSIGRWDPSVNAGFWGSGSLYIGSGTGDSQATWSAQVPAPGRYEVSVWFIHSPNRAPDATYLVTHADGVSEVQIDQRVNGSKWLPLGVYRFEVGIPATVLLTNAATGQYISADAVRFRTEAQALAAPADVAVAPAPPVAAPAPPRQIAAAPAPFVAPAAAPAPASSPFGQRAPQAPASPFSGMAPTPTPEPTGPQPSNPFAAGGPAAAPAAAPAPPAPVSGPFTGRAPAANPFAGGAPSAAGPAPSSGPFGGAPVAAPAAAPAPAYAPAPATGGPINPFAGGAAPAAAPASSGPFSSRQAAAPTAPNQVFAPAPSAGGSPFGTAPSAGGAPAVAQAGAPFQPAVTMSPAPAAPVAEVNFAPSATRVGQILAQDAGKEREVAGTILSTFTSQHGMLIRLDDGSGRMDIFIMKHVAEKLKSEQKRLLADGKQLHVKGEIRFYQNRPEIRISRPDAILNQR